LKEYKKWIPYIVDIYLPIRNSENGDLISLPFEGSIMDQPYMTMAIIKLAQLNYKKFLEQKMKKLKSK